MGDVYRIWTVSMSNSKKMDPAIHLLDTTAKSGVKAFAPNWNDVMRYKDGVVSDEQYTDLYLRKMAESKLTKREDWKRLLAYHDVAVACYCRPGKFCHRHLFVPLMQRYLEDLGHTVEIKGENGGVPYIPNAPGSSDYKPELKINPRTDITPFYTSADVLSNHAPHAFTIKGITFKWNEQFIMYCKAKLFGDHEMAGKILNAHHPQICKVMGRQVKNYDDNLWKLKRRSYSFRGSLQIARECPEVREYLLSTGNNILVEASASDTAWGVGLAMDDPRIMDPDHWKGANIQGEVWMDVRRHLQNEIIF